MKLLGTYKPGSKELRDAPFFNRADFLPLIFLLRHGQIKTDQKKRFLGQTNLPLSSRGVDQAKTWAQALAPMKFKKIYTSGLERCLHTAKIIARDQPVIKDDRLNEINMGDWDNRSFDFIKQTQGPAFARRGSDMAEFRPPRGESFQDLYDRCLPFFSFLEKNPVHPALIVTHSGVIRTMVSWYLGKGLDQIFDIPMGYAHLFVLGKPHPK